MDPAFQFPRAVGGQEHMRGMGVDLPLGHDAGDRAVGDGGGDRVGNGSGVGRMTGHGNAPSSLKPVPAMRGIAHGADAPFDARAGGLHSA